MRPNKNLVAIKFDMSGKGKVNVGGIELIRASRWVIEEDDGHNGGSRTDVQRDRRITNPQNATVTGVAEGSKFNVGDEVFVHYLAYETANWVDDETAVIREENIFFIYRDGEIVPFGNNFIGEEIYREPERTPSGIYVTSQEKVKDSLKVRITNVPDNNGHIHIGDIVICVDVNQYVFTFKEKTYIKLKDYEIICKVVEEKLLPVA